MEFIKRTFKWLLKTVVAITFALLAVIILLSVMISRISDENGPEKFIRQGSYMLLRFPDGLNESPSHEFNLLKFRLYDLSKRPLIFSDVLDKIFQASSDDRIKGIMLDLDNWNISVEHTGEIIKALKDLKLEDKKILAFGSTLNTANYYAASVADEIIIDPSNSVPIILNGPGVTVPYFKNAAEKLGIGVNVVHIGRFKGAGENFSRDNMSDEYRISILKILDQRLDVFCTEVAESRSLDKNEFEGQIKEGSLVFITPAEALKYGLADKLRSFDGILKDLDIDKKNIISIHNYSYKSDIANKKDKIAVILAEGNISGSGSDNDLSFIGITPSRIKKIVSEIKEHDDIKAVVLRVNSPGGSSLASEKILRMLKELGSKIPLVVSMGPVAASGGYYISCAGEKILAEPNTVTGSIGVVSIIPNFSGLYDKIGINSERISTGKYSDIFDLTKENNEEDILLLQKAMKRIYEEFKERVSESRDISPQSTEELAQGQIWTGEQAVANGLADELGGLTKAIELSAELAGIEDYGAVYFPKNYTLSQKIFSSGISLGASDTFFRTGDVFKDELMYLKKNLILDKRPLLLLPVSFD
ncbi:MAG: signal peptide peptidase SppA [Candidatus Delongbacteria bacterium]